MKTLNRPTASIPTQAENLSAMSDTVRKLWSQTLPTSTVGRQKLLIDLTLLELDVERLHIRAAVRQFGCQPHHHRRTGEHAGEVIVSTADDIGADVVVLAGTSRAGVEDLFLGHTIHHVLEDVDQTVVVAVAPSHAPVEPSPSMPNEPLLTASPL